MIIPLGVWMTVGMVAFLIAWILFAMHFWKAYYTAHNMRVADPIFCRWIKSCLRIGFVFGALSSMLIPFFMYLLAHVS